MKWESYDLNHERFKKDYLSTNFGNIVVGRSQDDIEKVLGKRLESDEWKGNSIQEKAYNCLLSIGVSNDNLNKIYNILVE